MIKIFNALKISEKIKSQAKKNSNNNGNNEKHEIDF